MVTPERTSTGPLAGLLVLEVGSMGPGPFAAMILADLGAEVVRIDRAHGASLPGPNHDFRKEVMHRGRRSVAVDLKHPDGADVVLELAERADVLIEGFRPGVAERLGLGPEDCLRRNPRIIYGRMTGFGQDGPLSQDVGHDINYIATSGLLSLIGRKGAPPTPPLSLLGDFGGGGMLLAMGVLAALWETERSGQGQVIDAAMVDGAALLGTAFFGFMPSGAWRQQRGANLVDSGAPFYDSYETSDGGWIAVGAMEPHFYADLLAVLDLDEESLPGRQYDETAWPALKRAFSERFRTRTRDEWVAAAAGRNACLHPVLTMEEATVSDHARARGSFTEINGIRQPAPAPRFSRTPASVTVQPPVPGEHTAEVLADWGTPKWRIAEWLQSGAVVGAEAAGVPGGNHAAVIESPTESPTERPAESPAEARA
jgi:alpha-methylacyl-CoA racemase